MSCDIQKKYLILENREVMALTRSNAAQSDYILGLDYL